MWSTWRLLRMAFWYTWILPPYNDSVCGAPVGCWGWPSGTPGSYSWRSGRIDPPTPARRSSGGCSGSHSKYAGTESPETGTHKVIQCSGSRSKYAGTVSPETGTHDVYTILNVSYSIWITYSLFWFPLQICLNGILLKQEHITCI